MEILCEAFELKVGVLQGGEADYYRKWISYAGFEEINS